MEDGERARIRVDALNLAYGILINQFQSKMGQPGQTSLTNPIPTTESVLKEARKLTDFIES